MKSPCPVQAVHPLDAPDPPRDPIMVDFAALLFVIAGFLVLGAWFAVQVYGP